MKRKRPTTKRIVHSGWYSPLIAGRGQFAVIGGSVWLPKTATGYRVVVEYTTSRRKR